MPIGLEIKHKYGVAVGDTHVHEDDIPEAWNLIVWLVKSVKEMNATLNTKVLIMFMGDQYHKFGVKEVVVEEFWKKAYAYILSELGYPSLSLSGNHDQNQQLTANGMSVHDDYTVVVAKKPLLLKSGNAAAIGYIRHEEEFYGTVMELYAQGVRKIFCHADFDGAQFENGFYSPSGFALDKYPADLMFYSGHIHLKQSFGNVVFFGTPRHLTRSDMGEVKGVHVIDFETGGMNFQETPVDVWSPFMELTVEDGPDLQARLQQIEHTVKNVLTTPAKLYVEIKGTKEFVKTIERKLPGGVKIRSTYTDEKRAVTVKESEGIPATFSKFSDGFFKEANTPDHLRKEVLDRIYQTCPSLKNGVI